MSLKLAIVTTSVRTQRVGLDVANWTLENAKEISKDAVYEMVDLQNFDLPLLGSPNATEKQLLAVQEWGKVMEGYDAYIFAVAEYNHLLTGAIKNAIDFLKPQLANKVASFVGYGAFGGARAIESFRMMLGELQVALTQRTVNFLLAADFENYTVLKPKEYHKEALAQLLAQNLKWAQALKAIR
jgi:NAD(P)H-dependent FMN reductase